MKLKKVTGVVWSDSENGRRKCCTWTEYEQDTREG